jgi:hypothetical protein
MRTVTRIGPLIALGAVLGANSGVSQPSAEELARNRRELKDLRADAERYARLERDLRAFYALPAERQEKLRRLDRELHEEGPARRARLWGVLRRYAAWLERLPHTDRQRVLSAPSAEARLAIIKELREKEWIEKLPKHSSLRRSLLLSRPEQRAKWVASERRKERERRAMRPKATYPTRMKELPPEVVAFVKDKLAPQLNKKEKARLVKQADGKAWPALLLTIHALARNHPVLPPVHGRKPVVKFDDLPKEYKQALFRADPQKKEEVAAELKPREGRWPDYALKATMIARRRRKVLPPLGASKPAEFAPEIRTFLEEEFLSRLSLPEQKALKLLEGRWPEYPRRLHELAREKQIVIPGLTLPGSPELWAPVRRP